jgi:hypothetical protein
LVILPPTPTHQIIQADGCFSALKDFWGRTFCTFLALFTYKLLAAVSLLWKITQKAPVNLGPPIQSTISQFSLTHFHCSTPLFTTYPPCSIISSISFFKVEQDFNDIGNLKAKSF